MSSAVDRLAVRVARRVAHRIRTELDGPDPSDRVFVRVPELELDDPAELTGAADG